MTGIVIDADDLHSFVVQICRAMGSDLRESTLVADQLVMANLTGHDSHGVGMVPRYVRAWRDGGLVLNQTVDVVRDGAAVLTLDGQRGYGQVIVAQAMELGIERAREHGVAVVALHNCHHVGRVGHWADQCAQAGMASFHLVNVAGHTQVAPWGGSDGRFGTNPFCIGYPRPGQPPLVLDFATSAVAIGKTRVAFNKGEPLPAGCAIDHQGQPTTDPAVLVQPPLGALLPFGQHKGFGLAVMCELFGGAFSGGYTTRDETRPTTNAIINGMFSVIIDPGAVEAPDAAAQADAFIQWVKASPEASDQSVLEPGEAERRCLERRRCDGIPIDGSSWAQITEAAKLAGLSPASWPPTV